MSSSSLPELLLPYDADAALSPKLCETLDRYLDLLIRWNGRTNLTALRDRAQLAQRQVGESLFATTLLPAETRTLLDFGSGAGFPGIPLQLLRSELQVTLAESQGKKASFLREACRTLGLPCEVWAHRVEALPATAVFDAVIMRAVDESARMMPVACALVAQGGCLLRFISSAEQGHTTAGWFVEAEVSVPRSSGLLQRLRRA